MRLTEEQSRDLLRRHGVWIKERCDRCGKAILKSYTWTRQGQPEVYCLQVFRDGVARTPGKCDYCGAVLEGKRRWTRFCGERCRKRFVRDPQRVQDSPNIADSGLVESSTCEPQNRGVAIPVSPADS